MALITGIDSTNAVVSNIDVGSTSKGIYAEPIDSLGVLAGTSKTLFVITANITGSSGALATKSSTLYRDGVSIETQNNHAIADGKNLIILGMSLAVTTTDTHIPAAIATLNILNQVSGTGNQGIVCMCTAGSKMGAASAANGVSSSSSNANFGMWPSGMLIKNIGGQRSLFLQAGGMANTNWDIAVWGYEF